MSEAIFWILDAPGETFGQHILDFGGLRGASGPFWKPFWRRFGVQDRCEHGNLLYSGIYALACMGAWFFNVLGMDLGWFLMVRGGSEVTLKGFGELWKLKWSSGGLRVTKNMSKAICSILQAQGAESTGSGR